jgi:anti-sigma-K factor RskA
MTEDDFERVGEYVLGLIEGEALVSFERRLAAEPELAAAVDRLRQHLAKLDDTVMPIDANPLLWQRIEAQLDTPPAVSPPPPQRAANDNGWLRRMGVAATVLVALGAGYLAGATMQSAPQPRLIAVLLNEDGTQPGVIVETFADDSIRLVSLDLAERPDDRVYQVWTLPDPETGPVSMGIFDEPGTMRLTGPDLPLPEDGQLYEITLEPSGGSPTGRPTGPILVKGFARAPI